MLGLTLTPAFAFLQTGFAGTRSDLQSVLVNLGLVLFLSQVLSWHYRRFSPVASNKRKFARTFGFIATTTMLVITIVKTSLALSLGLVGALSIIRFRTPIKEPEELAYLFLAIVVGLGLGASDPATNGTLQDLRLITIVVFAGVLIYMGITGGTSAGALPPRMLVHVDGVVPEGTSEAVVNELVAAAGQGVPRVDLRRVDSGPTGPDGQVFQATLVLDLADVGQVGALVSRLQAVVPSGTVSVIEGNSLD